MIEYVVWAAGRRAEWDCVTSGLQGQREAALAKLIFSIFCLGALTALFGCNNYQTLPSASEAQHSSATDYLIGPGD
ncbi:MAG TPA: hypothetical protein VN823_16820, partial [Stellaceae bacterium]|nr:hypothetical protein [Stellaceae bacterium]